MTTQEILNQIKKRNFNPVYVLHGQEPFDIDLISETIANTVLTDSEKAFNQHIFYGKEADPVTIMDYAMQYPMMAQHKVIILKEAQEMRNLKQLEKYIANPAASTILVICHKHKKLDARSTFFKTAKKSALIHESRKLYDSQLPGWIDTFVKSLGYQINAPAIATIVEYLGNDLSKIANEIRKLIINLEGVREITEQHIFDHIGVSKEYNVFELQKAIGLKDHYRTMQIVKYFAENIRQHPFVLLVGNLYNFFSKLYITKSLERSSDQEIAKALGLRSTYFVREYKQAARQFKMQEIETILGILKEYDLRSKGVNNRSVPHEELMREMIQKIFFVHALPEAQ